MPLSSTLILPTTSKKLQRDNIFKYIILNISIENNIIIILIYYQEAKHVLGIATMCLRHRLVEINA